MITIKCLYCRKSFETFPSRLLLTNNGGRFCSSKHASLWFKEPEQRIFAFLKKVKKTEKCWIWTGVKDPKGYGRPGRGGLAHRFSYTVFKGPIPKNKCLLHKCDNPSCVNPDHLKIGNQADNNIDAFKKHRHSFGENHGRSKLTEKNVIHIRELSKKGISNKMIAEIFGLKSDVTVHLIRTHKTWKHLKNI